jgi:hypothetical protein
MASWIAKVREMNEDHSIRSIIDMARTISSSGQVGMKQSKSEADTVVAQLIGGADLDFSAKHGSNYWNFLKSMVNDYAASRQLDAEFVVKGSPFNWHSTVGTKCGAVILRRGFQKGDAHIEPELFLEVGILADEHGNPFPGVACGFHYLQSPVEKESRFVGGVLQDATLRSTALALSSDGFINPVYRSHGPREFWAPQAFLVKRWGENELPSDLPQKVFRTFDELLPFYRRVVKL